MSFLVCSFFNYVHQDLRKAEYNLLCSPVYYSRSIIALLFLVNKPLILSWSSSSLIHVNPMVRIRALVFSCCFCNMIEMLKDVFH